MIEPGRLFVIAGATATGKSDLAVALASEIDAEIINADSMQLYRGMDIGTAKLTMEERYNDADSSALLGGQLLSRVTPQPGFSWRRRNTEVLGWYAADVLIRHGSGTVGVDHRSQLRANHAFSRTFRMNFSTGLWRVSDPTSLPRPGLANAFLPIVYGRSDLQLEKEVSSRLRAQLNYRFEGASLLGEGQRPGFYHAPAIAVNWAQSTRTTQSLEYRTQLFQEPSAQASAHGLLASIQHSFNRQWNASLGAGPTYLLQGEQGGFLPRVFLDLRRDGRHSRIELSAGQDLIGASGLSAVLWAQFVSVYASWALSRDLRLSLVANYFRNAQPQPFQNGFAQTQLPLSEGYLGGIRFEWRLLPQLTAMATVDRLDQRAAGAMFASNLGGIRFVFTPSAAF